MNQTEELLLPSDAAVILGLSSAGVKVAVRSGRLKVAAKTPRGVHIFRRKDVESFRRSRARQRGGRVLCATQEASS